MSATPERSREHATEPVTAPVTDDADQLRALVSAMLSGTYKEEFYLWDVASLCRAKPDFARQLLTLIDRYHRLGQMPAAQHRKIKEKIERTMVSRGPPVAKAPPPDTSAEAQRVSTTTAAVQAASVGASASLEPAGPNVTAPLPATADAAAVDAAPAVPAESVAKPAPGSARATPSAAATAPAAATHVASDAPPPAPANAPANGTPLATAASTGSTATAIPATPDSTPPLTIGPGTVLRNRYELQTLLGCGGMGSVYKAFDRYRASLGLPDCCVALKIVTVQPLRIGNLMALGREFHNAQQLSHPNVVNVYEIDHEGDASFYTMELLEGERLSQLVERTGAPLPARYALTIIRDIGAAIAHAHSRAVVHADLKPHNIFVTYGGQVRVLDFGGLSLTPREPWIGDLTPGQRSSSYRTATPAYASCEQLDGQRADSRDDIYALACIAYELLAGRHPFNGKSSTEARAQRLHPRRPPALRAECWRALRRGLAWNREQRPPQIEPWLAQLGVAAAAEHLPPTHQLAAARPPRPRIGRAVAVVLLLGLGGAVFGIEQRHGLDWRQTLAATQATLQGAWQQLQSGYGASTPVAVVAPSVPTAAPDSGAAQPAAAARAPTGAAGSSPAVPNKPARSPAPQAQPHDTADAAATTAPDAVSTDSVAPIGVKFATLSYAVPDTAPAARLVIRRTGSSRDDVRFVWWTEEDSAKADVDYAPLGRRTEHIPSGENNITIYIPIISNPLRHQTTKFYVALSVPGAADPAVPSERATVTIERGG